MLPDTLLYRCGSQERNAPLKSLQNPSNREINYCRMPFLLYYRYNSLRKEFYRFDLHIFPYTVHFCHKTPYAKAYDPLLFYWRKIPQTKGAAELRFFLHHNKALLRYS